MKIVITFDTLEEFEKFRNPVITPEAVKEIEATGKRIAEMRPRYSDMVEEQVSPETVKQIEEKAEEAAKLIEEIEKPAPEPEEQKQVEAEEALATPPVPEPVPKLSAEELKVMARKALAELNKVKQKNIATKLVKELGFTSFKEVTKAEDFQKLLERAKEEMDA